MGGDDRLSHTHLHALYIKPRVLWALAPEWGGAERAVWGGERDDQRGGAADWPGRERVSSRQGLSGRPWKGLVEWLAASGLEKASWFEKRKEESSPSLIYILPLHHPNLDRTRSCTGTLPLGRCRTACTWGRRRRRCGEQGGRRERAQCFLIDSLNARMHAGRNWKEGGERIHKE